MTVFTIPQTSGEPIIITADAMISASYENSAIVTENPVEDQPNKSDHYKAELDVFTCTVVFTDTPIKAYPDFTNGVQFEMRSNDQKALVLMADRESDRSQRVYDAFLQSQKDGVLISITTTRRSYQNIAFKKIRMDRDSSTGKAYRLVCECKVVSVVNTATTTAAIPRRPRGRGRNNNGARNGSDTTNGDESQRRQSVLFRAVN